MSTLACPYCGTKFTPRDSRQKTCGSDECKKAYQRARYQSRRQTDERKAYERSRRQTDEYKAYHRAYKRAVRTAKSLGIPPLVFAAMKIMSQLQEPNHDSSQRTA